MSNSIKVLIADDSFFMRKLLRTLLEGAGGIEVVGEAKDGQEVIGLAKHLAPDVITMDYNMPLVTGAVATEVIVSEVSPAPAIIMLSSYTKEGADETLVSLRAGAVDFVSKPSGEISLDIEKISDELIKKIRIAATARVLKGKKEVLRKARVVPGAKRRDKLVPSWLVVIGASTGGPPVLEEILTHIPADIQAAFLIVQHMPEVFTERFARRLDDVSDLEIHEAVNGDIVKEGSVLLAPGDFHMTLEKKNKGYIVNLNKDEAVQGLRPSIDVLFSSVSKVWDGKLIVIELTGMGNDGSHSVQQLKKNGATVLVQSLETTVVESMPESFIELGVVDEILSPVKIAERIVSLTKDN